ncbi:MAG: V-type ATPase subunit [Anaerolineae bacterium]|nr:V-type ATPase subunit [Anaerolineae bacterium]
MSTRTYALIQAATRALYSRMLSDAEWHELIHTQDFEALLGELSKTVYGSYLQLDRRMLTPRRVVYQIKRRLADQYSKIIHLAPKPAAHLIAQLWRSHEVDNIKAILRGIETGATWEQVLFLLSPVPAHAQLSIADMGKMLQSGEIVRAIERLKGISYYDTLSHAIQRYQNEHNLFPLEVALDLAYYRELWRDIQQLPKHDQPHAMRITGTYLVANNVLWALRYHIYHHLSEEEIINYTLELTPRVSNADIRMIARGEEIGATVARIFPEIANRIPEKLADNTQGLRTLELLLQRHGVEICRKAFVGDPFQVGIPLAYLHLMGHEIRDLTTIIEAKASQMPTTLFAPQLELSTPFDRDAMR